MPSAQVDARGGLIVAAELASLANQKSMVLERAGTVSTDPPSLATNVDGLSTAVIARAKVGDLIFVTIPPTINDGYIMRGAAITAAGVLTIEWANTTGGTINPDALEIAFLLFRATA